MTDITEKALPGRPHAIPDQRFYDKIQDRLDSNPHETIDDIAYTWLFKEVGGTRQRAKELLDKFKAGYIAKQAEGLPEVPEEVQELGHKMANQLVTEVFLMGHQACSKELKEQRESDSVEIRRLRNQQDELEKIGFQDEEKLMEKEEQIDALEKANKQLQSDLGRCRDTLTDLSGKEVEQSKELIRLRETVDQQQFRLNEQTEQLVRQEEDIDSLRRKLDESHGNNTELSQQLMASKSDQALAVQETKMVRSQLEKANQKIDDLEQASAELSEKLHKADLDKAVAQSIVLSSESRISAAEAMLEETKILYTGQVDDLKKQVEELEKKLKATEKKGK